VQRYWHEKLGYSQGNCAVVRFQLNADYRATGYLVEGDNIAPGTGHLLTLGAILIVGHGWCRIRRRSV